MHIGDSWYAPSSLFIVGVFVIIRILSSQGFSFGLYFTNTRIDISNFKAYEFRVPNSAEAGESSVAERLER